MACRILEMLVICNFLISVYMSNYLSRNTVLQCVLNNDVLMNLLLNAPDCFKINPNSNGNVGKALKKLLKALSASQGTTNLTALLRNLKASVGRLSFLNVEIHILELALTRNFLIMVA